MWLQTVAERVTAKTPKQCAPSAVRLTATSSGISVDEAAVIAAEAAAAGDTAPAALARVFPKARAMLVSLERIWSVLVRTRSDAWWSSGAQAGNPSNLPQVLTACKPGTPLKTLGGCRGACMKR